VRKRNSFCLRMATSSTVPPLPPVSSKAKDYSTDRPTEVTDELDDLRTRGIAKVLNRHFTATTKQLAKEKAEADAALADLERRRAQTSEFRPSKGGEGLNPFDTLYVQLQQRRAECRRKERETMLLYQRYVMKYGKSAKAVSPMKKVPTPTSSSAKGNGTAIMTALKEEEEDANQSTHSNNCKSDPPGVSAYDTAEGNSSHLDSCGRVSPSDGQVDRREESTKQFMSALTKFMSEESHDDSSPAAFSFEAEEGKMKRSELVSDLPVQTSKDSMGDKVMDDGYIPPETKTLAPKVNLFMSAVSNFMSPHQQETKEEEAENEEGGDNGDDGNEIESPADDEVEASDDQVIMVESDDRKVHEVAPSTLSTYQPAAVDADFSQSVETRSIRETTVEEVVPLKGLPNAAAAPVLVETEEGVDAMHETAIAEGVRKKSSDPPERVAQQSSKDREALPPTPTRQELTDVAAVTPLTSEVNETPSFTTTTVDDGDDVDDRSIISGLTFNSAVTRQVMDEIETEMEDFLKTETAAIRRMLDSQDEHSSTIDMDYEGAGTGDSLSSQIGDESVRVAMKAEAMALEMQRILDEFAKEDSSEVGDESEVVDENGTVATRTSSSVNKYPYPFEPAIPGEEWYVYFDDNYKREFFLEKRSNRTQWDPPNSVPSHMDDQTVVTSDDFLSDIHSVTSGRVSLSRRSSRRHLYRRQRRKRRTRRLVASLFAFVCILASVFNWRVNHPEKTFSAALTTTLATTLASLENNLDLERTKTYFVDQLEYTFTDRRAREEAEAARIQADALARQEQRARQLAALKAEEEAEKRARLEAERMAREKVINDEALRQELIQQEAIRQEEARRAVEENDNAEVSLSKNEEESYPAKRPWACNIPFSFIHPRCNKILKVNPVYIDESMIFLQ
jgi:hypothetical protein